MSESKWRTAYAKPQGKSFLAFACLVFLSSILGCGLTYAAVTGVCSNCHTMHNSQNGSPLARVGTVGWGSGGLAGGALSPEPMSTLLVTSCVGCHTSTTTSTIITYGGSRIPIVYNTVEPEDPLAGGNFYWVAQGGAVNDTKGHNVYGISGQDANLSEAPGFNSSVTFSCDNTTCHTSLATPPVPGTTPGNANRGGCQGCHVYTAHHDDSKPWYRFLKAHRGWTNTGDDYVLKTANNEDDDWEQETTTRHNQYYGSVATYSSHGTGLTSQQTISAFCSGCHAVFHGPYYEDSGIVEGMGSASPWIRHPTDISLPSSGEYAGYDPVNNYSDEAPVAWVAPETPSRAGAVVMCLSCHRVHGSDQPDLLRWDYERMELGGGDGGGCFTCHTSKD